MTQYDAIIIGTGQSGPSLAKRLAGEGWTVAIIERDKFGGTCVNTGCTPTKTLVASAEVAYIARRAADFGVVIDGPVRVDMKKIKARKDAVVAPSNTGVEKSLRSTKNCTVYQGRARFTGPHEIRVGDDVLGSDHIFINVGGRASIPNMPGLDKIDYLTNSSMMGIDSLPSHLVIVGGSYVGLEFAQMYRRFGSEVTVIEMGPHLIGREDEDTSAAVQSTAVVMAETLLGWGVPVVALRMGARGSLVATPGGEVYTVPAVPTTVVDTTGAGDAYCGGFLVALGSGVDAGEAGAWAAVSASFAIEQFGVPIFDERTQVEAQRRLAWARDRIMSSQVGAAS
jgi:thioredoxin reductase